MILECNADLEVSFKLFICICKFIFILHYDVRACYAQDEVCGAKAALCDRCCLSVCLSVSTIRQSRFHWTWYCDCVIPVGRIHWRLV